MKRILFVFAVMATLALAVSCGKPSDKLVKTWTLTEAFRNDKNFVEEMMATRMQAVEADTTLSDSARDAMKAEITAQVEELKAKLTASTMTFNADGTYASNMMGQTSTGKWTLSDDGKQLITVEGDRTDTIMVAKLDENALELTRTQGEESMRMVFSAGAAAPAAAH